MVVAVKRRLVCIANTPPIQFGNAHNRRQRFFFRVDDVAANAMLDHLGHGATIPGDDRSPQAIASIMTRPKGSGSLNSARANFLPRGREAEGLNPAAVTENFLTQMEEEIAWLATLLASLFCSRRADRSLHVLSFLRRRQ
jgi:hypothetical protein